MFSHLPIKFLYPRSIMKPLGGWWRDVQHQKRQTNLAFTHQFPVVRVGFQCGQAPKLNQNSVIWGWMCFTRQTGSSHSNKCPHLLVCFGGCRLSVKLTLPTVSVHSVPCISCNSNFLWDLTSGFLRLLYVALFSLKALCFYLCDTSK